MCAKYHYKAKMEPWSPGYNLSCHGFHHHVHEVNCGVLCVYTIGLRGFHHREELALVSLCWPQRKHLTPQV
jgi:hypothetical protein